MEVGLVSPLPWNQSLAVDELMWNSSGSANDDDGDSWEVRAFEEDTTGNVLGCTWPPRSYACTFCQREFRSAQALGGHMNVHRRDRARMHHDAPPVLPSSQSVVEGSSLLIPATGQELYANGLCLLYPLANHNAILIPTPPVGFSSHHLPISTFSIDDKPIHHTAADGVGSTLCQPEHPSLSNRSVEDDNNNYSQVGHEGIRDSTTSKELDLELRLGRRSTP